MKTLTLNNQTFREVRTEINYSGKERTVLANSKGQEIYLDRVLKLNPYVEITDETVPAPKL